MAAFTLPLPVAQPFYAILQSAEPAIAAGRDPLEVLGLEQGQVDLSKVAADACEANCPHLLIALLEKYGVDVDLIESEGFTLLVIAAKYNACKCIKALITRGASINLRAGSVFDPAGDKFTALYAAAEKGHLASCQVLVDAGADVKMRPSARGLTSLHAAARVGAVGIIDLLLGAGADPNATCTSEHHTPIFYASLGQHTLAVESLLPHIDPAHLDVYGTSLLHWAAMASTPDIVEAILPRFIEAGLVDIPSRMNLRNEEAAIGVTPLMLVCQGLDANMWTDKSMVVYGGTVKHNVPKYVEMKLLLEAGASRYAKDSNNVTPLHYAVYSMSIARLELLLGTAPNWHYTPQQLNDAKSVKGWTPLYTAVRGGSVSMCRLLIQAGASPDSSYGNPARQIWPDRPELASLFDPDAVHEPYTPPCCAGCQKSDIKLSACAQRHAVRYCGGACQRAHWREHKPTCIAPADVWTKVRARAGD
jgi:ankyrin repeat protein